MDQRRVLIVESQNEFALSLATILRNQGYATALAQNAAEAQREIEKRRPDLLVLRAELPDMSGFSLCGQLKKMREPVQVVLMSSDASDAFAQHQAGPTPADGYLAIPFAMEDLAAVVDRLLIETAPIIGGEVEGSSEGDDLDQSLDQSLGLAPAPAPAPGAAAGAPPPVPKGGPPKLPKRERRSALTDDDRQFLERVFGSIADRKAELLAEAKSAKRPAARRELLSSPEGKLQLLREEVKTRESQIARLSEIWSARDRELLTVEDRLHDKDVEVQGLKMQIDDLLRRFNEAQEAFVQKEQEHGATVDDLLLQRFSSEKDLIEVVASKEKDLNALKRELNHRDDELARRQVELDTSHEQYAQLEKQGQLETLQGEVRESKLRSTLDRRELEIDGLQADVDYAVTEALWVREERDARIDELTRELKDYDAALSRIQWQLDQAVAQLTARAEAAELAVPLLWQALAQERAERVAAEAEWFASLADAEESLFETDQLAQDLRHQRDGIHQVMVARVEERQAEIERLSKELAEKIRQADGREAELSGELSQKLERIGELEGEVEALKQHLEERERELNHQVTQLITDLEVTQSDLEQTRSDLANTQDAKRASEEKLNAEIAADVTKIAELEQQVVHTRDEGAKALAAEEQRAAEELAAFKEAAQQRYTERETELTAQIDAHVAEASKLREQVGNLEGELASLEQVRAELEQGLVEARTHGEQMVAQLQKERTERAEQVGDLEGQLEAVRIEKTDLQKQLHETQQHATELQAQLNELTDAKAQVDATLATTQSQLAETTRAYQAEHAAHGTLQGEHAALTTAKAEVDATLSATQAQLAETSGAYEAEQGAHAALREEHESLAATHKGLQTEFGQREARITEVSGDFAATETALHAAEDKLNAQVEESQRQIELLSKDLSAHKQALADTKGKLNATAQEKQRRETELKLEVDKRGEAMKSLETQVTITKQQGDERLAENEKKRVEVEAALAQTRDHAKKVTATAQELQRRLEAANLQLDGLKKDSTAATSQRDQKLTEVSAELGKEKAARRKAEEEAQQLKALGETKLKDALAKVEAARAEGAQKEQNAQQQIQLRTKKIQEMESALESAQAAKSKAERDVAAKGGASEAKERELTSRLQQAMRALKEQEAKVLAAVEDANTKAKAEIERRDAQRATETQRLQQSLQEKSKALKVAELEVQRLKSKADAPAARPPTARPPSTSTNQLVRPSPPGAVKSVPPPQARPPSDFEATSMMNRNNLMSMLKEEQQTKPGTKAAPGGPPPPPSPMEEAVERTVVMRAPAPAATEPPEDDWTSVVDGLDK